MDRIIVTIILTMIVFLLFVFICKQKKYIEGYNLLKKHALIICTFIALLVGAFVNQTNSIFGIQFSDPAVPIDASDPFRLSKRIATKEEMEKAKTFNKHAPIGSYVSKTYIGETASEVFDVSSRAAIEAGYRIFSTSGKSDNFIVIYEKVK